MHVHGVVKDTGLHGESMFASSLFVPCSLSSPLFLMTFSPAFDATPPKGIVSWFSSLPFFGGGFYLLCLDSTQQSQTYRYHHQPTNEKKYLYKLISPTRNQPTKLFIHPYFNNSTASSLSYLLFFCILFSRPCRLFFFLFLFQFLSSRFDSPSFYIPESFFLYIYPSCMFVCF